MLLARSLRSLPRRLFSDRPAGSPPAESHHITFWADNNARFDQALAAHKQKWLNANLGKSEKDFPDEALCGFYGEWALENRQRMIDYHDKWMKEAFSAIIPDMKRAWMERMK
jgi:hypothetical protein